MLAVSRVWCRAECPLYFIGRYDRRPVSEVRRVVCLSITGISIQSSALGSWWGMWFGERDLREGFRAQKLVVSEARLG